VLLYLHELREALRRRSLTHNAELSAVFSDLSPSALSWNRFLHINRVCPNKKEEESYSGNIIL
jgi:hypothetical protein